MSNYILGPDADLDLNDIWEYIVRDSIDAADRWIGKLFDAFEALGKTPGMGHKRETSPRIRCCSGRSAPTSLSTAPGAALPR